MQYEHKHNSYLKSKDIASGFNRYYVWILIEDFISDWTVIFS